MNFKGIYYSLTFRLALAIGLTAALTYQALEKEWGWFLFLGIGWLAALRGISLLFKRNAQKVAFMFDAIDNSDYAFKYATRGRSSNDKLVSDSLNRITQILFQAKAEAIQKEKYYELIMNQVNTGIIVEDDKGNIFYLVYGYINRGRHEGMNGIQVMKYDAKTNCNEEISFLSTSLPYDSMKEDLEKFSYLNSKSVFYCILEGDLHEIDLEKKKDKILESGLVNESLTASKDQSIIAIEKEQNLYKNKQIEMIDLESGKKQNFTAGSDKRIRAVGFLSNDFIYGEANAVNVSKSSNGTVSFPITKIHIVDINGKTIKEYQKAGRYIMSTQIKGSILEMTLGKRTGGKIQKTGTKDYIRYKEKEESDAVTLTSKYTDTYWTQLYLKFPNYVYIQVVPDLLLTKIMVNEDDVTLKLSNSGEQLEQYFVYASGTQKAVYTNLTEAIARAYTERGNVIDSKENVLWKCIYADYAQVAGMDNVVKVQSDAKSLAGCLSMIAAVNGKEAAPDSIDIGKGSIEQLMKKYSGHTARNLTGCTVDEILYYVSQGSPVLAKLNSNRYVIVMSYNATKIRYLDPVTGKSTAASRTDVTNRLEKSGKVFYSYIAD